MPQRKLFGDQSHRLWGACVRASAARLSQPIGGTTSCPRDLAKIKRSGPLLPFQSSGQSQQPLAPLKHRHPTYRLVQRCAGALGVGGDLAHREGQTGPVQRVWNRFDPQRPGGGADRRTLLRELALEPAPQLPRPPVQADARPVSPREPHQRRAAGCDATQPDAIGGNDRRKPVHGAYRRGHRAYRLSTGAEGQPRPGRPARSPGWPRNIPRCGRRASRGPTVGSDRSACLGRSAGARGSALARHGAATDDSASRSCLRVSPEPERVTTPLRPATATGRHHQRARGSAALSAASDPAEQAPTARAPSGSGPEPPAPAPGRRRGS